MKYTHQTSKTVWEDVLIEVPDGVTYFSTLDEDGEIEYYYQLSISKDKKFETLYDICVTKIKICEDDYYISYNQYCQDILPWYLIGYFSGKKEKQWITAKHFNTVMHEIIDKFKQ